MSEYDLIKFVLDTSEEIDEETIKVVSDDHMDPSQKQIFIESVLGMSKDIENKDERTIEVVSDDHMNPLQKKNSISDNEGLDERTIEAVSDFLDTMLTISPENIKDKESEIKNKMLNLDNILSILEDKPNKTKTIEFLEECLKKYEIKPCKYIESITELEKLEAKNFIMGTLYKKQGGSKRKKSKTRNRRTKNKR